MTEAQQALLKILDDGPPFEMLESMQRPNESAKVQYSTWYKLRVKPLIEAMLQPEEKPAAGGWSIGGGLSVGRDFAAGDMNKRNEE